MNVPNRLSLLRIILGPFFVAFFLIGQNWSIITAIAIFIVATVTDFLDGQIARSTNQVTELGKLLDPIADKLLVCFGLFLVVESRALVSDIIPIGVLSIGAALIIGRELMISIIRQIGAYKGVIIHANIFGKIKAVFQYIAIPLLMLLSLRDALIKISSDLYQILYWLTFVIFIIAVFFTVLSAIIYIVQNRSVFKSIENKKEDKPKEKTATK